MAKKRIDPIKQREKRSKMMLGVCGGVLLLALVFEGPTMLKLFSPAKPPVPAGSAAPISATSAGGLAPPALPGTRAGAEAPGPGELADTDVPPTTAAEGQLVSFGLFESKNPFTPQVTSNPTGATAPSTAPPATAAGRVPPATTGPAPGGGSGTATSGGSVDAPTPAKSGFTPTVVPPAASAPASSTPSPPSTPAPAPAPAASTSATSTTPAVPAGAAVTISVNGRSERVAKDGTFPAVAPVFRLVSFVKGVAQIGIVGGSYQTGDPTLTLRQGTPVTLENTSDGKRYKLLLLATP